MNINNRVLAKAFMTRATAEQDAQQWGELIARLLSKLELDEQERARAVKHYEQLAEQVADRLEVDKTNVHVIVQGSMRTQTTVAPRGREKFDLDIVVKLSGDRFRRVAPDDFFNDFGDALRGLSAAAGEPKPKSRCWRLQFAGEPFYFDVTPALPDSVGITGTDLRVRDPETGWSPSNPEEFAEWFCKTAELRFAFQQLVRAGIAMDERKIDDVPTESVAIDDILRRTVQIMKLHRDLMYYGASQEVKEGKPISVILVTLATWAYQAAYASPTRYRNPIEVLLDVVERMPEFIKTMGGEFVVSNPAHGEENFAERWNGDHGVRAKAFFAWHARLKEDLAALFSDTYSRISEERIRNVFGEQGVDAWKGSIKPTNAGILSSLMNSAPSGARENPSKAVSVGHNKDTLA